ncbi:MAG TPA: aminotransferase class V-fold PLP-dependent enzyme [Stellaceae bacterium]|nr:aminotransferase class V-fold PLP-dependent enzyme [Stellaceae bacterium]
MSEAQALDVAPARFGAAARAEWPLDPAVTYLNHGGYGVAPHAVLAAQRAWRERIERNPTRFHAREQPHSLRDAAAKVAAALGTSGETLVFVENATSGVNAVLRSLPLKPGDEIVATSLAYPAVLNAARFTAERAGAILREVPLSLPVSGAESVIDAVLAALGPRTRIVIIDHIASGSALVLPVNSIVRRCRERGVPVLVDGAHAPGQILLDLDALDADWYVGTLHKWFFAPRACGILRAAPVARQILHPLAISHGLGQGFAAEFDWTGTHDFTTALAAPDGLDFHRALGGRDLMARNAALVRSAANGLAASWRTEAAGPPEMFAAMASVRLPIDGDATPDRAVRVARWLAEAHRIEAAVICAGRALWIRVAAQAYNEAADYHTLEAAIAMGVPP